MDYNYLWLEELNLLSTIILKTPLDKTTKWGTDVYTYNGKNVVSYAGFKNCFTLWFYNGVFLKDTYKVLINAQEGKTKSLRQWRFNSIEEIDEKKILEYVAEAIEIEKEGLKLKPRKLIPLPLPQIFSDEFIINVDLKNSFENLSPAKQNEYITYLNEAKQISTKLSRLEKIKPMILSGTGLNDRYK